MSNRDRASLQTTSTTTATTTSSGSPIPSTILSLADGQSNQIDAAAMDFFLIELVNTLRESSAVALARQKKVELEMIEAGLLPPPGGSGSSNTLAASSSSGKRESASTTNVSAHDSVTSLASRGTPTAKGQVVDEEEEAVRTRLEAIGLHVGANFTERLCRDRPLFAETLDAIKFVCKDVWSACWDKQVDNLRTNHRGVYVLQDNSFKTISRLSSWEGRAEAIRRARLYVAMPAGIIRGALSRLGLHATVVPEVTSLPQCTFQVKLPKGT